MSEQRVAVDLADRDPNSINQHVQVAFEDVLAEPDSLHSIDCVWKISYLCFNCGKNCCYKLMTFLCGIFIALYWGCEFALVTFDQVWCITPGIRIFTIYTECGRKYLTACLNCCLAPVCETFGLCFSKIAVANK